LIILKKLIALEVTRFFIEVIMQSILVVTVSCILFFVINYFAKQTLSNGYLKIILAIIVSVSTVYFIGLDKNEKKYISLMIKEKF
jgi:hypothetical protein